MPNCMVRNSSNVTLDPGVLWYWSGCSCRFCIFISEDTFGSEGKGTALHGDGKNSTQRVPPLAYLKSWALGHGSEKEPVRGEFCLLEAEVENGLPFYALCWADRKLKTIISNVGTTNLGTPSKRRRYKKEMVDGIWETVSYFKEVKQPAMVEEFFSCFSTIDRHDHLRQGSLALEREWYTHKW